MSIDNQTTADQPDKKRHYKRVLYPKGKPVPQKEGDSVTPRGHNIEIRPDGFYGTYKICFTNGGREPPEFNGRFTTTTEAQKVIDKYLRDYHF